jgi:hypothetical protein
MSTRFWWAVRHKNHSGWFTYRSTVAHSRLLEKMYLYLGPYRTKGELEAFIKSVEVGV